MVYVHSEFHPDMVFQVSVKIQVPRGIKSHWEPHSELEQGVQYVNLVFGEVYVNEKLVLSQSKFKILF